VTSNSVTLDQQRPFAATAASREAHRWLGWLFWAAAVGILMYQLGGAGLFDPDEGRNSEKAREILVLNDWVTPHENFHPVLDKPMFFYWLVAFSYKLFGVSEWSARLPSALAAFGCLIIVYRFADRRWGRWEALWSALILLTCAQFFVLARIVILDTPLTFFLTLALCAFYEAVHADEAKRRRWWCLAMYVSLGAAALIKGLIGVVVPGMIFFFYLLLTHRWSILRKIYLIPGALIFLAIVLPWYLQADARHDGYLRYFLWDEHFGRFTSDVFDRAEPWYYFILVGLIGFFPWTLALPFVVREYWKKRMDDKTLFLTLWVGLPFVFFSASESKLPHYLLPIFPALSILTAAALVTLWRKTETISLAFSLIWLAQSLAILYLIAGAIIPVILPVPIRAGVSAISQFFWLYGAFLVLSFAYLSMSRAARRLPTQPQLYLVHGFAMLVFLTFVVEIMFLVSHDRSAKAVAEKALSQIGESTQLVFYDTHLPGMPFYVQAERPIWLVTHGDKKRTFLGHYYEVAERKDLTTPWGDAIFDFGEFREKWQTATRPFLIVVKDKNLRRLARDVGEEPTKVADIDGYALVTKQLTSRKPFYAAAAYGVKDDSK
jgi:4-amino-4-deoxy-L-arabinose transferase-like glycosyltransferase